MKVPQAVKNLKLCQAFKGHNPSIVSCTEEINDEIFYIEDHEQKKYTIKVQQPTQGKICKILNPQKESVVLLPIDNKFIKKYTGEIADAAVFNEHEFHFIEFKTNAEGNSDKSVKATYDKAMNQLKETLKLFENKITATNIHFREKVDVECNMIVSESFPRNNAMEMTNQILFALQTEGIPLNFENEINLVTDQHN